MEISNIRITASPASKMMVRAAADIHYDDAPGQSEILWFDVPVEYRHRLSTNGDPWLAALLPLASKLGEPLKIDGHIDPVLYESPIELMEWWRYWFPEMQVVKVVANIGEANSVPAEERVAQFFSGGADSFFTLLRHNNDENLVSVDDLLIGWGFDISLSDKESFERVVDSLIPAVGSLDKNLVQFATNIRETRFKSLPWGEIGHGNAMAAIALLLQGAYNRVLIPSTDGYDEKGPWGSHATTDHFYSSSTMRIIHDGAAYTRFQKVELVAESKAALSALRVCWRSQSDQNCGECEKCLRTMVALDLCNVLEDTPTFGHTELDLKKVRRIHCPHTETGSFHLYYDEMFDQARQRGRLKVADAIAKALRRSTWKEPLLKFTNRLRANRYTGFIGRPLDAALRRTIII